MSRDRRIMKELADIQQDHDSSGIIAAPASEGSMRHLKGTFPAPPDTPYSGGTYTIDIQIPDQYPFKAPVMKFDTKIWHPNVSSQTVSCKMGWAGMETRDPSYVLKGNQDWTNQKQNLGLGSNHRQAVTD